MGTGKEHIKGYIIITGATFTTNFCSIHYLVPIDETSGLLAVKALMHATLPWHRTVTGALECTHIDSFVLVNANSGLAEQ